MSLREHIRALGEREMRDALLAAAERHVEARGLKRDTNGVAFYDSPDGPPPDHEIPPWAKVVIWIPDNGRKLT